MGPLSTRRFAPPMGGVRIPGAGAATGRAGRACPSLADVLDQSARASLRSACGRCADGWRRARVDGERVGLRDEPGLWLDVCEFERSPPVIRRALELCRGDLLEGPEDDWAMSAATAIASA